MMRSQFQTSKMKTWAQALLLVLLSEVVILTEGADPVVEFTVEEEKTIGLELGSLGDDDVLPLELEPGVRLSLRYSLLPQGTPHDSLFRVDEDTGQIFAIGRINREELCKFDTTCDLDIQVAVQSAISQFFKKVKVVIKVQDINDNPPEFPRSNIQVNMPENVATGTSFPLQGAEDLDIGQFGVQAYELTPSSGAFYVNVTRSDDGPSVVNLVVRHELDRETRPSHSLVLTARDGGKTPLTGSVSITVSVDDVNDNPPMFEHSTYNVSLPETAVSGAPVVRVSATDYDTPKFGVKEYRFSPLERDDVRKYFTINASTGQITVAGSLLERQGKTFRLLVECLDKGLPPLVSRAEVDVTVEDTTNSAPVINLNVMFGGAVSEVAQSGTVVALLNVVDHDAGHRGIVSCSIVSDAFELQPRSVSEYKVIVVRRLDRESEPVHNVSVLCQDAGSPPLSDTVTFLVKVKDENDNAPYFSKAVYEITMPENNRPGQILLRVDAKDDDVGENARLTYNLIDAEEFLRIDDRGNIVAVKPLDHEEKAVLRFKVMASDNGTPQKARTADVIITVTDLNDEAPLFKSLQYNFEVTENMPANTSLSRVSADDKDSGDNGKISYSLLPKMSPFRILADGLIVTKESLDREMKPVYALTVLATDSGVPALTGTAQVKIKVRDQNDHHPRIIYPRNGNNSVAVSFDAKRGSVVLTILAEDADDGPNKKLVYHLASNSARAMFELSRDTGDLILTRELTPQDVGRHRLTIVVTDKSKSFPLASNSSFDVVIFAPNETAGAGQDKEKEHVLVVIILGVVTGVVTVAVIITIVVIRRADTQRRKYIQNRAKMSPEVEKLEAEKPSVGYVISNSAQDGAKTKGSNDGGDDASRDLTQDEGFADKSFNTSQGSSGTADQNEWSKALRLHQDLLKMHGVGPGLLMHGTAGDDVNSDGSGESTTCDSGRGGSEEDNGSHGRASPVNKDGSIMNNLNHPTRPQRPLHGPRVANIPRSGFPPLSGRQLGHSLDAQLPSQNPPRSFSAPPVKHVSFRDDYRSEWPELLPPHPRGHGAMMPPPIPEKWGSASKVGHGGVPRGMGELTVNLDHSFETAEDGNSTTTSGSYTVDDLSPRGIGINYNPEQAVV
ncbi:protocadherin alpha-6 [Aplysia californica]|uniref:Protocadherin alpha-6 n=1 Tax=Aplysia californica TaxID=6500 RepID=A0ABM0ZXM6_APLCA|nr:protocadherin alpha-6 [Aplysia californica]